MSEPDQIAEQHKRGKAGVSKTPAFQLGSTVLSGQLGKNVLVGRISNNALSGRISNNALTGQIGSNKLAGQCALVIDWI